MDQSVMKRIAALLQKTVENGCTEEEAASAARLASDLMNKYQISQSAAELGAEGMVHVAIPFDDSPAMTFGKEFAVRECISIVAQLYCGVRQWADSYELKHDRKKALHLIGLKSDVEMAIWMIDTLSVAAWNLAVKNTEHVRGEKRVFRKNFIRGFQAGLEVQARRIQSEREEKGEDKLSDGKSLVVVKNDLNEAKLSSMGVKLRSLARHTTMDDTYVKGVNEGIKTNLGRPIEAGAQKLLGA